jgi:hypothetical protein
MIIDTVVYITTYETLGVTHILVLGTKETRVLSEYNLHLLVSQLKSPLFIEVPCIRLNQEGND